MIKFLVVSASAAMLAPGALAFQSTAFLASPVGRPAAPKMSTQTSLSALMDVDYAAPRDVNTMWNWAYEYGAVTGDGWEFTTDETGLDTSVMTNQDVPSETTVAYVPAELMLTAEGAKAEIGFQSEAEDRLISAMARDEIPKFYLFLKVLLEFQYGNESAWFPWLNSLPRRYSNGASMTPFCFDCLPPLAGYLAALERIRYGQFKRLLDSCVSDELISPEIKKNGRIVKWAYNVVYTRSLRNPYTRDWILAPLADMFNHGTEYEVDITYDDAGNLYAMTNQDVPAGAPLRMQYADPTNPSHLLARYGFLDKTSPATFCKIMINNPSPELINMGYDHSRMLFYHETGDVSEEVWDVLLFLYLQETDPTTMHNFYQAHINGDVETKQAMHNQYYGATLEKLNKHVDDFLLELDALQQKGEGKSVDEHPRLPLIQSHNEFVRETFWKVKEQLYQYA